MVIRIFSKFHENRLKTYEVADTRFGTELKINSHHWKRGSKHNPIKYDPHQVVITDSDCFPKIEKSNQIRTQVDEGDLTADVKNRAITLAERVRS